MAGIKRKANLIQEDESDEEDYLNEADSEEERETAKQAKWEARKKRETASYNYAHQVCGRGVSIGAVACI